MIRFMISLSEWNHDKLILWAKLRGVNRASMASTLIANILENEWKEIESDIAAIAEQQGKTLNELKAEWLSDKDDFK